MKKSAPHVFLRYHKPAGVLSTTLPTKDGKNILQGLKPAQVKFVVFI